MKDNEETDRVNKVMQEILIYANAAYSDLSIEGYSVVSDSSQNPHTFVEIYNDRITLKAYQKVLDAFTKEFIDHSITDFLMPDHHGVHERSRLILQISEKAGGWQQ